MRFRNDKRFQFFIQSNSRMKMTIIHRLPFVSRTKTNGTNCPLIYWVNMFIVSIPLLIEQAFWNWHNHSFFSKPERKLKPVFSLGWGAYWKLWINQEDSSPLDLQEMASTVLRRDCLMSLQEWPSWGPYGSIFRTC